MTAIYLKLLFALCFGLLTSIHCENKELNFKLRKLEKVHEDENEFHSELRLEKADEDGPVKISGELKQMVSIDNEWKVHIIIHYAENAEEEHQEMLKMDAGACDVLRTQYKMLFYEKLKKYSNAPHPDTCPLPPEHYHLKDYPFDADKFKKFMQPGFYRIVVKLIKDEHIKLEYLAEAHVE